MEVVAGCGASAQGPSASAQGPSACGSPPYTLTLPNGPRVLSGSCSGLLPPKAPAVTVRRGETFTVMTGDAMIGVPPVPRPSGPAVVVSVVRPRDHATMVIYRAVQSGHVVLVVPNYRQFCAAKGDRKLPCSAAAFAVQVVG